ncbi:MAG TPA: hypothetical protein VJO16_00635 [Candidatus Acidoferrum sp.]|nr:hypothetical protein [Candidatus Acidoferrum sp.]
MKINLLILSAAMLLSFCPPSASAQVEDFPNLAGTPPKVLLLVQQEFRSGKVGERQKLEVAISRACDQVNVPNSWIDLESITGSPRALFFDPFDSFEHVDASFAEWPQIFASHPGLARLQEELKALVSYERTVIAVRRDDLGFRPQSIDFSKARFLRVLEVQLRPGHESDFVEAFRILGGAYEKIKANAPWVVYQVNVGMPSPTFLVFVPMHALKQNDDLLDWRRSLREAEGEEGAQQMEQIAKDAYASTESNLYFISPETSHVSKDFADGDPGFWSPKPSAATKPASRKDAEAKPKP